MFNVIRAKSESIKFLCVSINVVLVKYRPLKG